jgi:hypothetical protein
MISKNMTFPRLSVACIVAAIVLSAVTSVPSISAAPVALSGSSDPDLLHGVRTKWVTSGNNGARDSIIPDLQGLAVPDWARNLEGIGVNMADLNLEPKNNLVSTQVAPLDQLTVQQIEQGQYTPQQRNDALVAFLQQVKAAHDSGAVKQREMPASKCCR